MRSVELTFEVATDQHVRSDWARLAGLGLPSLATHTSPSNSPHITLAAGSDLDLGPGARDSWRSLPIDVQFSGLVVFPAGRGKYVLARLVVLSRGLQELHTRVHQHCSGALATTRPDAWTPHVTLARRIPDNQLGTAIAAVDIRTEARCDAVRLWDSSTRTITTLSRAQEV